MLGEQLKKKKPSKALEVKKKYKKKWKTAMQDLMKWHGKLQYSIAGRA